MRWFTCHWSIPLVPIAVILAGCTEEPPPPSAPALGGDSPLAGTFREIGRASGVPAELLATLSFVSTRLTMIAPASEGNVHAAPPAWGLMAIDDVPRAASAARLSASAVRSDARANVQAAAALIAQGAGVPAPRTLADWVMVLGRLAGQPLAREVWRHMAHGWRGNDDQGRRVILSASVSAEGDPFALAGSHSSIERITQGLGYPPAIWNPAPSNYADGSRGAPGSIKYVVIHTTEGSYAGTISWFKNPAARVSAHYVVRSSDGEITHMVDDADIAWHAGCYNSTSIGIEHEGFVADPAKWYTDPMYMASAGLTAWLTSQYAIPRDRQHIVGHVELTSCNDHQDPGPGWNWTRYMAAVTGGGEMKLDARAAGSSYPMSMLSGQETVVWLELVNDGNIGWGVNETRVGTQDPVNRASPFFASGNWLSPSRASGADRPDYLPGKTGRFSFVMRAPSVGQPTTYKETFQLVQEAGAPVWFGPKITMTILVSPAGAAADAANGDGSGTDTRTALPPLPPVETPAPDAAPDVAHDARAPDTSRDEDDVRSAEAAGTDDLPTGLTRGGGCRYAEAATNIGATPAALAWLLVIGALLRRRR